MDVKYWAADAIAKGATLLHRSSCIVGVPTKFYDGKEEAWTSSVNGEPVPDPVIELDAGGEVRHGLLAVPEEFLVLTENEVRFYKGIQQGLAAIVAVAARGAAGNGVDLDAGFALLSCAFRTQLAALEVPIEEAPR